MFHILSHSTSDSSEEVLTAKCNLAPFDSLDVEMQASSSAEVALLALFTAPDRILCEVTAE
jgi:hypothetical protein